jgi:hypothetical protein
LGTHTYTVDAGSLDGFNGVTSITYTVVEPTTTTTLSASVNPAVVGQTITYTALVSPIPDGGTVAFSDRGIAISGCGAVPVDVTTGEAVCNVSYAKQGLHTITATYSGDATWNGSSAGPMTESVNRHAAK